MQPVYFSLVTGDQHVFLIPFPSIRSASASKNITYPNEGFVFSVIHSRFDFIQSHMYRNGRLSLLVALLQILGAIVNLRNAPVIRFIMSVSPYV